MLGYDMKEVKGLLVLLPGQPTHSPSAPVRKAVHLPQVPWHLCAFHPAGSAEPSVGTWKYQALPTLDSLSGFSNISSVTHSIATR